MSIEEICEKYNITNYYIGDDGSIDVDGDVNLSRRNLSELPLKFDRVNGLFDCSDNHLTDLKGAPKSTMGFFCSDNLLTNLEGCPEKSYNVHCNRNQLTTLEGSPKSVSGGFNCSNNKLNDLKGGPEIVGGIFDCRHNKLTSLEYYPEHIGSYFYCNSNPIGSISEEMDIDFIKAFNTFKVIKDGVVNLKRLKYVMEMFDKPVNLEKIKKYYTIK